jgi:lipoprotein signal peptidase
MLYKNRYFFSAFFCGFFFIFDQFLKWQALHSSKQPHIFLTYFGWSPFLNPGIAFGIPIPNKLIIVLTVPVILVLMYLVFDPKKTSLLKTTALNIPTLPASQKIFTPIAILLILTGAVSNLIDRILYHYTIDYFLFFTAVINISDILIVSGFVLYFVQTCRQKKLH